LGYEQAMYDEDEKTTTGVNFNYKEEVKKNLHYGLYK
jgi:hypothetical protein